MGTKNNPGDYDCYANAEPDEPMFILLGRDPTASLVVEFWCALKAQMVVDGTSKSSEKKLSEARHCAESMRTWAWTHEKDPGEAVKAMHRILARLDGRWSGT